MVLPKKFAGKILIFILGIVLFSFPVLTEEKAQNFGKIPKIPKTPNDPFLYDGHVYPNWGPPCQRYTYSVIYRDKDDRAPEYIRIWFNGEFKEMEKENPQNNDYKKGVKYIFKYVPKKIEANFFFFETNFLKKSEDLGKLEENKIEGGKTICGNTICEQGETKENYPKDCLTRD